MTRSPPSGSLVYAVEPVERVLVEGLSTGLVDANWQETGDPASVLQVDVGRYGELERAGQCVTMTARTVEGALAGYAIVLPCENRQSAKVQAMVDVVYLSPAHRRGRAGVVFLQFIDDVMKGYGVDELLHQTTPGRRFDAVLQRLGYAEISRVYARKL